MPYPKEHAARLQDPSKYDEFRRTAGGKLYNKISVPKTVSIIWGHPKGAPAGTFVPQALRFSKSAWTADEAKAWLKDNEVKNSGFEAAAEEEQLNTTEAIFTSLQRDLDKAVEDKFGGAYWMCDFSKDTVLMRKRPAPVNALQPVAVEVPDEQFFQAKYKFVNGEVEFDGNPVEVRRVVTYV